LSSVILDSFDVYKENIRLVLIFSIPFLIAFAIPLFAPLPTYISAGAIFLRSASIFVNGNINFISLSVITISTIFSLLFLSFAFVLISLIVKAKRTRSKIGRRAFLNIESYIGKVFTLFLAYTILLLVVNVLGYSVGMSAQLTAIVGFIVFTFLFYAPSATVVDDKKIARAIKDSILLIIHEPQYFLAWLVLLIIAVSAIDYACIYLFSTPLSSYIVLVINSLLVLPYFIIFQAEAYMSRFRLLRH
jgi:hypothetical protein